MAFWILDQWSSGELDYPTLGFRAQPNDILSAAAAPDSRWSSTASGPETVERYTVGSDPSYVEPTDGHVLAWSDSGNAYVATSLAASTGAMAEARDTGSAADINDSTSATRTALDGLYGVAGANTARFVSRARAGENLSITCIGDSILEGQTVTNPATDGTMILLAADLSTRFGVTVTQTNYASSGFTALNAFANGNTASAIAADADLYIVFADDKNGIGADIQPYAPGYPMAISLAALERIVRTIRRDVPKADIILLASNPYTAGSSSNAYQLAKDEAVRRVAAAYGCEFVDAYAAFADREGGYASLMADSTHPNTAGHRLIADTILGHLVDQPRPPIMTSAPATTGLYDPDKVREAVGNYGYVVALGTGTNLSGSGISWTNTGTFTGTGGSSDPYVTTTAGDYTEIVGQFSEATILLSTASADALVADVTVDGVVVANDQSFTLGKLGSGYYVTVASGLDPTVSHTVRVTLVSGTLKMQRVAVLAAQATAPPDLNVLSTVNVANTTSTTTLTTSYQSILNTTVSLPSGWTSGDLYLSGHLIYRNNGAMTADRRLDARVMVDGSQVNSLLQAPIKSEAATTTRSPLNFAGLRKGLTADAAVLLQVKVDNATDTIQAVTWVVDAIWYRTA